MDEERITVTQKQLTSAIAVWLRGIPKRVWEQWIEHRILAHYKRQSFSVERLDSEVAAHIAAEMTAKDWQVTHPAPRHSGSPPAWTSPSTPPVPPDHQPGNHGQGDN
jgi:hypothetical protein